MTDAAQGFDWGPLGEDWWTEAAKDVSRATTQHVKFACSIHRGCTRTEAARQSGYSGNDDDLRSNASRAYKTNAVQKLLAIASSVLEGATDGTLTRVDRRRILENLARHGGPNEKLRACEALDKMEERETEERVREAEASYKPSDTLDVLATMAYPLGEHFALALAKENSINWKPKANGHARRGAAAMTKHAVVNGADDHLEDDAEADAGAPGNGHYDAGSETPTGRSRDPWRTE